MSFETYASMCMHTHTHIHTVPWGEAKLKEQVVITTEWIPLWSVHSCFINKLSVFLSL